MKAKSLITENIDQNTDRLQIHIQANLNMSYNGCFDRLIQNYLTTTRLPAIINENDKQNDKLL